MGDRASTAIDIVNALAAQWPFAWVGKPHLYQCGICGGWSDVEEDTRLDIHDDWCAWRRAREFVREAANA